MKKQRSASDNRASRIEGGIYGLIIGDALGVPVEGESRDTLKVDPVVDMREYGNHYQPRGTWSDDSSLMLCTLEALIDGTGLPGIANNFVRWVDEEYWTPHGSVFDVGNTTATAIIRLKQGVPATEAGLDDEINNGNGSLMRILPVPLFYSKANIEALLAVAHAVSAITHKHKRSLMACGIYTLIVRQLLKGLEPDAAYHEAIRTAQDYYESALRAGEQEHFDRILSGEIHKMDEDDIKSSGYVIHTLEASIWALLTSESYTETVLKAVNLGGDADTTGACSGGLAGVYYRSVPAKFLKDLVRRRDIAKLLKKAIHVVEASDGEVKS